MATYLARPRPRCNGYLGIVLREAGRNTPLRAINGHCVQCGHRLAWILIRGKARRGNRSLNKAQQRRNQLGFLLQHPRGTNSQVAENAKDLDEKSNVVGLHGRIKTVEKSIVQGQKIKILKSRSREFKQELLEQRKSAFEFFPVHQCLRYCSSVPVFLAIYHSAENIFFACSQPLFGTVFQFYWRKTKVAST
jgi:hypothetical protein